MSERPLTEGEIAMARTIFGDAINYGRVRIHQRKWIFFQPRNVTMAPTGHIHFHPQSDAWREDYSKEGPGLQGHFIHEMTHVWQAQTAGRYFLPLMRHPFCRYGYHFKPGRPFLRYGLEQQAEIVRHVFQMRQGRPVKAGAALAELEAILPFKA